jgi:hypothetical protein
MLPGSFNASCQPANPQLPTLWESLTFSCCIGEDGARETSEDVEAGILPASKAASCRPAGNPVYWQPETAAATPQPQEVFRLLTTAQDRFNSRA